jgi:hypothetical protein
MSDVKKPKKLSLLARARELAAEAVAKAVLRLTGQALVPRAPAALTPAPLSHATPVERPRGKVVTIAGGASPAPRLQVESRPRPPTAPSHAPHVPSPGQDQPKEPLGLLDLEEVPELYGINECGLLVRDPQWIVAYWEVTPGAWERARAELRADGQLTLRLSIGERVVHQERLPWDHGRRGLRPPAVGVSIAVTVGLVAADGRFATMSQGPAVTVPPIESSPGEVMWMAVDPGGRPGERPRIRAFGDAGHVAAAVGAELSRRRIAWLASRAAGSFTPSEILLGMGSSAPTPVLPPGLPSSPSATGFASPARSASSSPGRRAP